MVEEVRKQLWELQDLNYQQFQSSLCPGINHIIGVRIPNIRLLVKKLLQQDYITYLEQVKNQYYEETMIEGLLIATSKLSISDKIFYFKRFVPKIDNWAICDTICSSFKFKKEDLELVWNYIISYQHSNREFELRFMIVMMMNSFLIDDYIEKVFAIMDSIQVDYYYTNMAIAWLISVAFVKNRKLTLQYLHTNHLSDFTYRKALQKILESNRVSKKDKEIIYNLKR